MGGSSEVGGSQKAGTGLMVWASTMTAVVVTATLVRLVHVVRGFITSRDAVYDPPQAILVLGGDRQRELLAARFAAGCSLFKSTDYQAAHADSVKMLPVYVSSAHDDAERVMKKEGVQPGRLHLDNGALDTVTNFTTMLGCFLKAGFTHVYVVTSDYHMRRAALLAGLIFRSGGLAFTPVSLPSSKDVREQCSETTTRIERDRIRAILWLLIGWHGAELLRFTKPNRYRLHKMRQALEKAD